MKTEFMTAKEVAEEFFNGECSYYKVLRLTRNGIIPAMKMGKSYMYMKAELEKWAELNFSRPAYAKAKFNM